jgi:hypothetical protein
MMQISYNVLHNGPEDIMVPADCSAYLSSCFMPLWIEVEGKLHSISSLVNSLARCTDFTKMTTCMVGLNSSVRGQGLGMNNCSHCPKMMRMLV